jgi:thiamine biosynthesis protein ThiI
VLFLVRFGEIHLKSKYVRKQFQDKLVANVQDHFASGSVECLTSSDRGRVYVETDDVAAGRSILRRVFGVVSFSAVVECHADLEAISKTLVEYSRNLVKEGASFAIRSRRAGSHAFTSRDVAVAAGKAMQDAYKSLKVDLSKPDIELFIEVRNNRAFIFHEVVEGPGGLPLGSQGRMLALVDGERGMVAAWMMMKRGSKVTVVATDGSEWIEPLRKWDLHLKVQRIARMDELREISKLNRAEVLAVGWTLEELESRKGEVPEELTVFHPAVGLTDEGLAGIAGRIRQGGK